MNYREDISRYMRGEYLNVQTVRSINFASSNSDKEALLEDLASAVDQGSANAALQLGYAYLLGLHGLPQDSTKATALWDQAVREEKAFALLIYGLALLSGNSIPADQERADALLLRAAQLDNDAAILILSEQLFGAGRDLSDEERKAWRAMLSDGLTADGLTRRNDAARPAREAVAYVMLAYYSTTGSLLRRDEAMATMLRGQVDPERLGPALAYAAFLLSKSELIWVDQAAARRYYEEVVDGAPPEVLNNYAWLLATAIDPVVRDGQQAVSIMQGQVSDNPDNAAWVDTLAAAYAAAGQFERAVATQERALELMDKDGRGYAEAVQRLDLYREGDIWRD